VLEPAGPSEALALAYKRLGSLLSWNAELDEALELLEHAVEIAERAGADLARVWSLIFIGGVDVGLGRVETGFARLDQAYREALARRYRFQVFNVSYNAAWEAVRLGFGDRVDTWSERVREALHDTTDAWPYYIRAMVSLEKGRIEQALAD
jgi:tetratricopeptide (TPR) repeat protein